MLCHKSFLLILAVAASAHAAPIPIPATPPPAFIDMERTTNAAIRPGALRDARVFKGEVSLLATPSNAVEVAFGASRDGTGVLLPGDESFSVGWDGGSWFVASATNRIFSAPLEGAARRSFSFKLHVSETGSPRALSLSADGAGDAFAALAASPPDWMFSRAWDAARLTVRGVVEAGEGVSVRLGADPWMLILR